MRYIFSIQSLIPFEDFSKFLERVFFLDSKTFYEKYREIE